MQRLLKDAQKLTGVHYDLGELDDVYNAIHAIQENLDVTGTTAKEAATTFSGSLASMKSAAQNLLGNLALGEDISPSLDALEETVFTFVTGNLLPMFGNVLKGIPDAFSGAVSMALRGLNMAGENADVLMEQGIQLVENFTLAVLSEIPYLCEAAVNLALSFGQTILETDWVSVARDCVGKLRDSFSLAAGEILGRENADVIAALTKMMSGTAPAFDSVAAAFGRVRDAVQPLISKFAEWITSAETARDASNLFSDVLGVLADIVSFAADSVAFAAETVAGFVDWLTDGSAGAKLMTSAIVGAVAAFQAFKIAAAISGVISSAVSVINKLKVATEGQTAAQVILNAVMKANPFALVVSLIAGLVAAVVTLWNTNEGFRNAVVKAWETVKTKAAELKNSVVGKFNELKDAVLGLINKARTWGHDLIENFKQGILNNPIAKVVSGVAGTIAGYLHHSTPDVGPLKNDDKWMPDMMAQFADGIRKNTGLVGNAAGDVALSVRESIAPASGWAARVGEEVSVGLANGTTDMMTRFADGIRRNTGLAESAAGDVAASVREAITPAPGWAARVGEEVSVGLANGIEEELSEAAKDAKDAAEKISSNLYNGLSKWASRTAKFERLSLPDQLSMWTEIQKQFAVSSENWWSVEEKLFDLRESVTQESYDNMANAIARSVKRENLSLTGQLAAWESVMSRFTAGSEQWTAAEEKAYDIRAQLQDEFAEKFKASAKTISGLQEDYQKALSDRANEIAGSYKLFDAVPEAAKVSAKELTKNLQEQIRSVRSFYGNLSELASRGVGDSLVEEIRRMGVGASGQLEALLSMSDRQLARYADLYGEKQSLANSIAARELESLGAETAAQIQEQLDGLRILYDEQAPLVGSAFADGVAAGIRNGMSGVLDAALEVTQGAVDRTRELLSIDPETVPALSAMSSGQYDALRRQAMSGLSASPAKSENSAWENQRFAQPIRIHVDTPLYLNGREIARASFDENIEETVRRGGTLPGVWLA